MSFTTFYTNIQVLRKATQCWW